MQQVDCITIFLCSMVATCESNENGRFSTRLGLAKPSMEGKSKMLFSRKENTISTNKTQSVCILVRG